MRAKTKKKSLCTGPHCAAILYLQNARERPDVSMYQMSALVSSQLPGNQNECFYLSNNCLCFTFPLLYGHHGAFKGSYGHFMEPSRNLHRLADERQLRTFHGTFTDNPTEPSRIYEYHRTIVDNHGNWS